MYEHEQALEKRQTCGEEEKIACASPVKRPSSNKGWSVHLVNNAWKRSNAATRTTLHDRDLRASSNKYLSHDEQDECLG